MGELRRPLQVYALGVIAIGVLALVASAPTSRPELPTLGLFVLLLGFATAGRMWPVHLSPKMKVTVEDTATFAAALLLGPFLAMIVTAGSVALGLRFRMRGPWIQHGFNASASGLATGAGAVAWLALVDADTTNIADHPIALLVAAVVKYGVETALVDTAVGLQLRRNPLVSWWPVHRRDIVPMAALYILGAVAAASVSGHPWLLSVFLVPVAVVLLTLRETARMREQTRAAIHQLADLVDLRDPYTHGHSQRVAALAARLAEAMHLPGTQVELIREAARVHDIGKIGTDDHVLQKPGPLDLGEEQEMHKHAAYGAQLLQQVPEFWEGASLVLAHHERLDGTGYPRGLRGSEVPIEVSVISVADAYDAMSTDRPYRAALPWEQARSEFLRHAGSQWDPAVVHAFVALIDAEQPTVAASRISADRVPEPA